MVNFEFDQIADSQCGFFYAVGQTCYHSMIFVYYPILLKFGLFPFFGKTKIKFELEQIRLIWIW